MIDLSIVIVSYNTRDLLSGCLESVTAPQDAAGADALNTEILVVDNASPDGSAEMVRARYPGVCLIANAENRGFSAANNQAFARTQGRYVLMLNPDTRVRPGALSVLVRFMDRNPRAGACGGRLLYGDGSFQHSAFAFPTLFQIALDFFPINWRLTDSRLNGRYPRRWYERGTPFQVGHLLGADLLVRRQVADKVGWLDDRFFIYCEEIDWCLRIHRAGWQIWCVPEAVIVHYEAQSTRQFRDRMYVELWRARVRLFQKHYGRAFRMLAGRIVRLGLWNQGRVLRRAASQGNESPDEMSRRLEAYAQVELLVASL